MYRVARFCSISLLLLVYLLSACNFQAARTPDAADQSQSQDALFTQAVQTVVAGLTQTAAAVPPSEPPPPPSSGPEATEEKAEIQGAPIDEAPPADQAPTETPTATVTPSETVPAMPIITADVSTNCRFGPNPGFEILGYLLEGETSEVHGKDRNGYWWYIANPDIPGGFCWVWAETTTVKGDANSLPYIEPPPTYTPTPTNTMTPTPTATATTDGYP